MPIVWQRFLHLNRLETPGLKHRNIVQLKLNKYQVCMFVMVTDMVQRKTLVLDLDETLIHSHHDGVLRQTVKPGTPPDFVLKVC